MKKPVCSGKSEQKKLVFLALMTCMLFFFFFGGIWLGKNMIIYNIVPSICILILCAVGLIWLFHCWFDKTRSIKNHNKSQKEPTKSDETMITRMTDLKQQAEYIVLQSQINPHFLYNTLDSIRGQVVTEGMYETANMLEALSNLFRYSISKKNVIITLEEELENVDDYMRIINYRFSNRFKLVKKIDTQDNSLMSFVLPKLTFQPLVENAVQHGMEKKKGPGTIIIRASRSERFAYFSVEDDGLGMDMDTLDSLNARLINASTERNGQKNSKHSGIALTNVASRLAILYGEEASVSVSSTLNHGTEINISVPMRKVADNE